MSVLREELLDLLKQHRPSGHNWDCTCGEMPSATYDTWPIAHREHLADALIEEVVAARVQQARAEALAPVLAECENAEDQPTWIDEDGDAWVEVAVIRAACADRKAGQ